jgi:glycosyltransferase involved in cell wall biosynthesis
MATPLPQLVLAAYTHFGAMGLKGNGMYYLVQEAWKKQYVQKIIVVSKKSCQYEFDFCLVDTLPGESRLISLLGQIREKMWSEFPARWLGESIIFDHYAASRLPRSGGVLITTPRLIHTTRKAKQLGYTTLLYSGTPHPQYMIEQVQTEHKAFGLKEARLLKTDSWEMTRFATHVATSDYILTVSEFAKRTYEQQGIPSERIFVAPLGVDLRKFHAIPPSPSPPFTYLFVGQVDGTTGVLKGLPYLLQAWDELALTDARLVICGHMGPEAQRILQPYGGKLKQVEFVGFVNNIEDYYQHASVFVLPSVAEGFAKVVAEAMASGRPVITTPIFDFVVREGLDGFITPFRDVAALKDRMLYFYQHREESARMGANASKQARQFSWERFSRQVAKIVEQLAKHRARAPDLVKPHPH